MHTPRALYIDDQDNAHSTERNMIWPEAPYPWGAKLHFACYGAYKGSFGRSIQDEVKGELSGSGMELRHIFIVCWI